MGANGREDEKGVCVCRGLGIGTFMDKATALPAPPAGRKGWPWIAADQDFPERMADGRPWPKISIVTPNFNYGRFLEKTIRSVLLQGYPNLEYIVMDGGSSDNSLEIIRRYEPWITTWKSEKDQGQADSINQGLALASGDLLAWLNSDDYYLPGALKAVATAYSHADAGIGALVGMAHKVDAKGEVVYTPKVPELTFEAFLDWMNYSHFMQPSCFFTRQAWADAGPLNASLSYCFDVDLWLKVARKYSFARLEAYLSHALVHDNAKTIADKERMRVETCLLIMQYGGEDIARRELLGMADELAEANRKLGLVEHIPFVSRIKPVIKKWFLPS